MICPRCGKELDEGSRVCIYCHEIIENEIGINDYKKDGFIHIKKNSDDDEQLVLKPKEDKATYFKISEMNIFVLAILFVMIVAVLTIFGLKVLQDWNNDTPTEREVPVYISPTTEPVTEKPILNTVKDVSIKSLYGSWRPTTSPESKGHAVPYYSFTETGAAQYNYGSLLVTGRFEDFSNDDTNRVYINIEERLYGVFEFDVTGNEEDGYIAVLINVDTHEKLTFVSAVAKTYVLDTIPNYKIDKKLLGEWRNDEEDKNYVFVSDGRFTRMLGNQEMYGVWSQEDEDILQFKYMEYSVRTISLKYNMFEDKLIINNVVYNKVIE